MSLFFLHVPAVFSAKVATIIRRLQLLERAKRKWNHLELSGTIWNARSATGTARSATTLTLKCVNFVNFVNNWQKCQCRIIVNMQLRWFFSTFIAFFSDFVHFTLKLFKNLYYLCTAIQNHRTLIARSSRYHRTHVHEWYTSSRWEPCGRFLNITRFPRLNKINFGYEK